MAYIFDNGICMIEDSANECNEFIGKLDLAMMLYVVPVEKVVGSTLDIPFVGILNTQEHALFVVTKGEYINKLHESFTVSQFQEDTSAVRCM